ncbi:HARB1-like protein, partial [Mya arenaria]
MKDSAIQFPTTDRHRHRTKTGFHAIRGFPSVISAVDGTHVRIQTPSEDEEQYVNRKHFHSINVQASCDHRGNENFIIRMKPLKVSKIVVCCVVLHNLAKLWGEPEEFPPEDDQQPSTVLNHDDDMSGKEVREYITMQYF